MSTDGKWNDCRRDVIMKIVQAYQDALGASANPANNPKWNDTRRDLLEKWNNIVNP
jgi:hypothetical protein